MAQDADDEFYDRAHEHLRVASGQLAGVARGKVSASMMYASARLNVWLSARDRRTVAELKSVYGETIEYFVAQYRRMLVKNLDDFVDNFDEYREAPKRSS